MVIISPPHISIISSNLLSLRPNLTVHFQQSITVKALQSTTVKLLQYSIINPLIFQQKFPVLHVENRYFIALPAPDNLKPMNFLLIKPSSVLLIPAHRHKNQAHENYLKIEHNFAHYPHMNCEKSRARERERKSMQNINNK